MREKDYPVEVVELKGTYSLLFLIIFWILIGVCRHRYGLFVGAKRRTICYCLH
jgi:hypothetical protein